MILTLDWEVFTRNSQSLWYSKSIENGEQRDWQLGLAQRRLTIVYSKRESKMSPVIYVVSILIGLWLGYAINEIQGALILGGIVAVVGFILSRVLTNYSHPEKIQNPKVAENLFSNPRYSLIWLPVRLFL